MELHRILVFLIARVYGMKCYYIRICIIMSLCLCGMTSYQIYMYLMMDLCLYHVKCYQLIYVHIIMGLCLRSERCYQIQIHLSMGLWLRNVCAFIRGTVISYLCSVKHYQRHTYYIPCQCDVAYKELLYNEALVHTVVFKPTYICQRYPISRQCIYLVICLPGIMVSNSVLCVRMSCLLYNYYNTSLCLFLSAVCPVGYYGSSCSSQCSSACGGRGCYSSRTNCLPHCPAGKTGTNCAASKLVTIHTLFILTIGLLQD